ncbi:MAG: hypothetical protein ACJAQT_001975 [Akkermansiaceae bacterium]|jgi:hypothetical protein
MDFESKVTTLSLTRRIIPVKLRKILHRSVVGGTEGRSTVLATQNLGRLPRRDGIGRNVLSHDRARPDCCTIPDLHSFQNPNPCSHEDVIPDHHRLRFAQSGAAPPTVFPMVEIVVKDLAACPDQAILPDLHPDKGAN